MNIVYLQVDLRHNGWLLEKIKDKYVIEYTLDKIKELDCGKTIAGIFDCKENRPLVEFLDKRGVNIVLSEDDNVNSRFVNLMAEESTEYIIRVGGDQLFLNSEIATQIIKEMQIQGKEFFYHSGLSCILPDVVSPECLRSRKENVLQGERYFNVLESDESVKRYCMPNWCTLLYDFRVKSNVGYRICRNVIEKNLDIYGLSMKLSNALRDNSNYLNRTGMLGSWILGNTYEDFFFDDNKMVNPWWGKSIIDLVVKRLDKNMRVFEWGMGNSTLFWSQYVAEVVSVESDAGWYQKMNGIIPHNVFPRYCKLEYDGEYCRKILDEKGEFDIVLIDGRDRVRCAYNSLEKLKENGVIIWDNTEREYYQDGYDFFKNHGFKQLEISSIVYGLPESEGFTSIFYRKDNVLGL